MRANANALTPRSFFERDVDNIGFETRRDSFSTSSNRVGTDRVLTAMDRVNIFEEDKLKLGCNSTGDDIVQPGDKDTQVQLVISLSLGITAFLAFCVS